MADRAARLRLRSIAKVAQYRLHSMAGHRSESWVKVKVRGTFRRKVAARDSKVSDSALRRHLRARAHMRGVDLSIGHRPPAHLRVKQEAREKEGRALMVSPVGSHHQEAERPLLAVQPEAEHLRREPSAARSSHNMERNNQRKERPGQGHNNSGVICDSGSGSKNSGAVFFATRKLFPKLFSPSLKCRIQAKKTQCEITATFWSAALLRRCSRKIRNRKRVVF